MAKTTLTFEFDSENHFDAQEINRILKSREMASVLFEITYNLKKRCKSEIENSKEINTTYDTVELVFEKIYELLESHSVNIDELIS